MANVQFQKFQNTGVKIGYARVSTVGQNLDSQKEILTNAGVTKIFEEKITGTKRDRPQLDALIDYIREGDEVFVTKIDRLARSISDLSDIVKAINRKGASITFIDNNMTFNADSDDAMQTLLFNVLGSFAQFERDLIVARTAEGRERAKAAGKHMGRRVGHSKEMIEKALYMYDNRKQDGHSIADITAATGLKKSSLYNELRKREARNTIK